MVKIQFILFKNNFFLQANQMHLIYVYVPFFGSLEVISTPLFLFRIVGKNTLWQGWCNVSKRQASLEKFWLHMFYPVLQHIALFYIMNMICIFVY